MEAERSNTAVPPSAIFLDAMVTEQIRQGLIDARMHAELRRRTEPPPHIRDQLLEESFPRLHPDDGKPTELMEDEFDRLRGALRGAVQSDIKQKMALLQIQLSEYHSILEEVSAFKSRCDQLEQEKKDLVSLCREVCQVRDDKIALLQKEVAQLRRSSSTMASELNVASASIMIMGRDSEGQLLRSSNLHHCCQQQTPATQAFTPQTPLGRRNGYDHHYFNEAHRRITLTPPSVSDLHPSVSELNPSVPDLHRLNLGALQPLPFPKTGATLFTSEERQEDFITHQ